MSLLRTIYRYIYWLPSDIRMLSGAGWPQHLIFYAFSSFGDDLLLGAILHEQHARGFRKLAVLSSNEEIFRGYPFPVTVLDKTYWLTIDAMQRWGGRATFANYLVGVRPPDIDIPGRGHIIAEMARKVGISGAVSLRTWMYLSETEREAGVRTSDQAVIQCSALTSINAAPNKIWPHLRYQEVVDENRDRLNFVQLGSLRDPLLRGVIDLRGKTTIRESAGILAMSRVYVGYVGFLMHLARAVECRSVIVYGGREHPDQSGYIANENLFTPLPCSPCWRQATCVADHQCMDAIQASDVTDAITRALARTGPLETAEELIA